MSDFPTSASDPESNGSTEKPKRRVSVFGRRFSTGALAAWVGVFALLALLAFQLTSLSKVLVVVPL